MGKNIKKEKKGKKAKGKEEEKTTKVENPPIAKVKKDKTNLFKKLKDKKKQTNSKLFVHRVTDKLNKEQVTQYLNEEIKRHISYQQTKKDLNEKVVKAIQKIEKYELQLFEQDSIHTGQQSIVESIVGLVRQFKKDAVYSDSLHIPNILVLTPDTYVVVDLVKELKQKLYSDDSKIEVQVKIQKLFSKHISIEEHQSLLDQSRRGKYINIFIGTPNRVKKLAELNSIKLNDKNFRMLIVDSKLNTKNFSIFDVNETRDDIFDILVLAYKRLTKRKL